MSTQIQHRRGTAAEHEAFTGAMSEFTHNTSSNRIHVHDGFTEGGHPTLMESDKGAPGGLATLDDEGHVPVDQLGNTKDAIQELIGQPNGLASLDEDGFVPEGQLGNIRKVLGAVKFVPTRSDLKGTAPVTIEVARVYNDGERNGDFIWRVGDFSSAVAGDPAENFYVPSSLIPSSAGCWVLKRPSPAITPQLFGAVGNGNPANVDLDTSGLKAALDYFMSPACDVYTLDLAGGVYYINSGWTAAANIDAKNKRITNGVIKVADTVTAGSFYALDFSPASNWISEFEIDNLGIQGSRSDSPETLLLKGGIKFRETSVCRVESCNIVGFTEAGIKQTSPLYGQALYITDCMIFGDFAGNFASRTTTNICVDLAGGDNAVRDCQIGNADELIRSRQNSNKFKGNHVFQYTNKSTKGIVCDKGFGYEILDNYIDTCKLILKSETSGNWQFHDTTIVSNRFYCPPMFNPGVPFSHISLAPQMANCSVNNLQIDNNSFTMDPVLPDVKSISVDTANGTIDAGQISNFSMRDNTFYGLEAVTSHPSLEIMITSATSGSVNAASKIPFGNIQYLKSACLEAGAPVAFSLSKTGTTVTATMAASWSGVVHVEASINATIYP